MWIDPDDSNNDSLYALGTYSNVPRAIKAASPHSLTHLVVQYAASLIKNVLPHFEAEDSQAVLCKCLKGCFYSAYQLDGERPNKSSKTNL